MKKDKPTFGRETIPCVYEEAWADKLPEEEVVTIIAYDNKERAEER